MGIKVEFIARSTMTNALIINDQMDEWIDGYSKWMDGWMDGQMEGWIDTMLSYVMYRMWKIECHMGNNNISDPILITRYVHPICLFA